MSRYVDFDAARAERVKEPLILKALGREFDLPPSMPLSIFTDIVAMEERGKSGIVTYVEQMSMLKLVLSDDVVDSFLADPSFDLEDLSTLLGMVMSAYTSDQPGGVPAPLRKAKSTPPRGKPES